MDYQKWSPTYIRRYKEPYFPPDRIKKLYNSFVFPHPPILT